MKTPEEYEIMARLYSGDERKSESKELQSWLKESPENKQIYFELQNILADATSYPEIELPNIDAEWQSLANHLDLHASKKSVRKKPLFNRIKTILGSVANPLQMGYAFATVFAIIAAVFVFSKFNQNNDFITVATTNSEQKNVLLSDGSQVQLNSSSKLVYPKNFAGNQRKVTFSGEALFKIKPDKVHPFIVETENAQTTVLGTQFNIWNRNNKTRVFVKEGKVALQNSASIENSEPVVLTANMQSECVANNSPKMPKPAIVEIALDWQNGKIIFKETPLAEIFQELEFVYNVNISSEKVDLTKTVSGEFSSSQKISNIISTVCLALDLDYQITNSANELTQITILEK